MGAKNLSDRQKYGKDDWTTSSDTSLGLAGNGTLRTNERSQRGCFRGSTKLSIAQEFGEVYDIWHITIYPIF